MDQVRITTSLVIILGFLAMGLDSPAQCDELRRIEQSGGVLVCQKATPYDSLIFRRAIAYTKEGNKPFTGNACSYYQDSVLQKMVSFKGGILNGPYKEWHENGKLKFRGSFKNNMLNGDFTYWYANGQVEYEGKITDNMRTGVFRTYHPNGQKAAEGGYVKDKRTAGWTEWYENGQKAAEGMYEDGEKTGQWHYWGPEGNEIEGPVETKDKDFELRQIELYKIWKNQTQEAE